VPGFPDLDRPLTAGDIELRLFAERDIPEILIAYQDDRQLHVRLGEPRPPSGAELGRRTERADADRRTGRAVTLTVVRQGSDLCVGQVRVRDVDWENLRCQLEVWVAPAERGRGYGRWALRLAAQWLLQECGLRRVALLAGAGNEPAIAAARAAGFVGEGVLRGYALVQGRRVDTAVMSLVGSDLAG
jgi:RimJ/RimL family protein N-acetyltransferase